VCVCVCLFVHTASLRLSCFINKWSSRTRSNSGNQSVCMCVCVHVCVCMCVYVCCIIRGLRQGECVFTPPPPVLPLYTGTCFHTEIGLDTFKEGVSLCVCVCVCVCGGGDNRRTTE